MTKKQVHTLSSSPTSFFRTKRCADEMDSPAVPASKYQQSAGITHLIILPYISKPIPGSAIEKEDLYKHALRLLNRIDNKPSRRPRIKSVPIDDPSFKLDLQDHPEYQELESIYIIGHSNGVEFGSKHYGFVDFTPSDLAVWLAHTGLLIPNTKIKLIGCHTAEEQEKFFGSSFAEAVSICIAVLNPPIDLSNITVRGYQGSVSESKDELRTLSRLSMDNPASPEEISEVSVPASSVARDFNLSVYRI